MTPESVHLTLIHINELHGDRVSESRAMLARRPLLAGD